MEVDGRFVIPNRGETAGGGLRWGWKGTEIGASVVRTTRSEYQRSGERHMYDKSNLVEVQRKPSQRSSECERRILTLIALSMITLSRRKGRAGPI